MVGKAGVSARATILSSVADILINYAAMLAMQIS
jgi:hypothetical protein